MIINTISEPTSHIQNACKAIPGKIVQTFHYFGVVFAIIKTIYFLFFPLKKQFYNHGLRGSNNIFSCILTSNKFHFQREIFLIIPKQNEEWKE